MGTKFSLEVGSSGVSRFFMPTFAHVRIAVVLILLFLLQSCNRRTPVACFVTPGQPMETDTQYEFRDCSDNAAEYIWDLGDGGTSEKPTPLYIYAEPGVYDILLKVSNKNKSDQMQRRITVTPNNLSRISAGDYIGTYAETYADSSKLDSAYDGQISVTSLDDKRILVMLNYGSFEADIIGTSPNYSFVSAEEITPPKLKSMDNVKGFYEHALNQFTFSLEGKNSEKGMTAWRIEFTGFKQE